MLTIALPKGRIAEDTLALMGKIFNRDFKFEGRKLISQSDQFRFLNVKNQDVATYVEYGAADIGIVGLDVIAEKELDILDLLDLQFGKCRISIALKSGENLDWSKPDIKIATKMVNITKKYFATKAVGVEIIKLNGSIELAPLVGLADAIVDVVETGTTIKENGLVEAEQIMTSSAHLIANKNSFFEKKSEILELYKKLERAVKEDAK